MQAYLLVVHTGLPAVEEGCLVGQGHALDSLAHLGTPVSTMAGYLLPCSECL